MRWGNCLPARSEYGQPARKRCLALHPLRAAAAQRDSARRSAMKALVNAPRDVRTIAGQVNAAQLRELARALIVAPGVESGPRSRNRVPVTLGEAVLVLHLAHL